MWLIRVMVVAKYWPFSIQAKVGSVMRLATDVQATKGFTVLLGLTLLGFDLVQSGFHAPLAKGVIPLIQTSPFLRKRGRITTLIDVASFWDIPHCLGKASSNPVCFIT